MSRHKECLNWKVDRVLANLFSTGIHPSIVSVTACPLLFGVYQPLFQEDLMLMVQDYRQRNRNNFWINIL